MAEKTSFTRRQQILQLENQLNNAIKNQPLPPSPNDPTAEPLAAAGNLDLGHLGAILSGDMEIVEGHEVSPEFISDAPWRIEPGRTTIPLTFIIHDGRSGGVKLQNITVHRATRTWRRSGPPLINLKADIPARLPFQIEQDFWSHHQLNGWAPEINLSQIKPSQKPGSFIRLIVTFQGVYLDHRSGKPVSISNLPASVQMLQIYWAQETLPLRNSNRWFYGDTHTHSCYTDNIKEFGNPIEDMCAAGLHIGLDWIIVTDHSIDLQNSQQDEAPQDFWTELQQDVQRFSNPHFRLLRGEEVAVRGYSRKFDNTLHVLVYQHEKLIPGAMWGASTEIPFLPPHIQKIIDQITPYVAGKIYPLPEVLAGQPQTPPNLSNPAFKDISVLAQNALAFAAHPTTDAQFKGSQWTQDDVDELVQHGHGMEAWNTRVSRSTTQEYAPFTDWKEVTTSWELSDNKRGIDLWEDALQQKVDRWKPGDPIPRFVLLAGTDAHGGFNYSAGWGFNLHDNNFVMANNNALGKVRTLLFFPQRPENEPRTVPESSDILNAIRAGRIIVTDGPVIDMYLSCKDRISYMGDMLEIAPGSPTTSVVACFNVFSNAEFGQDVVEWKIHTYFRRISQEHGIEIIFDDEHSFTNASIPPHSIGYLRASLNTRCPSIDTVNGVHITEEYRCFTNPIFIYNPTDHPIKLNIQSANAWPP